MNKQEFIDEVARYTGETKKTTTKLVDAVFKVIAESVANGETITFVGFGKFEPKIRAARQGRNPSTGEPINIPETRVPVFSAGSEFKKAVNK